MDVSLDGAPADAAVPPPLELVQWRERDDAIEAQVHGRRIQRKRHQDRDGKAVWLLLVRRRFRCWRCGHVFPEPDPACGFKRRTTARLRGNDRGHDRLAQPRSFGF